MNRNVLFITVDQWRGDCLSAFGHPVVETPALDRLAAAGHAVRQPLGQRRAVRTVAGPASTPGPTFTTTARCSTARRSTPASPTWRCWRGTPATTRCSSGTPTPASIPRTLPADDPRLPQLRGGPPRIPGGRPRSLARQAARSGARWLAAQGRRRTRPTRTISTDRSRGASPGSARVDVGAGPFRRRALRNRLHGANRSSNGSSATASEPFFVHASFIRPHPPRRNPAGYHDLYRADDLPPFVGAPTPGPRRPRPPAQPSRAGVLRMSAHPRTRRERRQMRATYYGAQREVDDQFGRALRLSRRLRA